MQTPLEYYACSGPITDLKGVDNLFDFLPSTVPSLCHLIQKLVLHPFEAQHYGVKIPKKRWKELDLCEVASLLQCAWELEPTPLNVERPLEKRLLGNCRDYATLLCAFLRAQHIPARVRYGFATYFEPNFYTDHVVCEYWNASQHRWVLVDAQMDVVLCQAYKVRVNTLDLPRDAFLLAGRAWQLYRDAAVEPDDFGISSSGPCGVAFIRTGVLHEVASLNKVELLCQEEWDIDEEEKQLQLIDQVALWTLQADTSLSQLSTLFERDTSFPIPTKIRSYA